MAPYTDECKQSTSSGIKPITNQVLAEILTLSQKSLLPEFHPLKKHKSENINSSASCKSSLVAVL